MAKVFVKIPKTGLGNMLMVWAHALLFARMNDLEIICSSWWGFRWGAIIRGDKRKRLYRHYFKETHFIKRNLYRAAFLFSEVIEDPDMGKLNEAGRKSPKTFTFKKVIRDNDLFKHLRDYQPLIKSELYKILDDKIKRQLTVYEAPFVGVHIRRGDFKIGNQTTPLNYFVNTINLLRKNAGKELPVTIFTDANETEITDVLDLPGVKLAEDKPDILDILLLSRSKVLILSKDSTFSYWSAFLSEALVIIPTTDWQMRIRYPGSEYMEIKWNDQDADLENELNRLLHLKNF